MAYGFGWWEPVPKEDLLVNRVSGQRLRRIGPVQLDDLRGQGNWLRFEYRDDEISFPVLAHLVRGEYRHPLQTLPIWKEGPILTVDYNRSADLWRQDRRLEAVHPPYGLWRRLDDCLMDAFCCWPRMKSRDRALAQIRLLGGWLNGAWRRDFLRTLPALTPLMRKWVAEGHHVFKAKEPVLVALDEEPASPWRFHPHPSDAPSSGQTAWLEFARIRLDSTVNVIDPPEPEGFQVLPRGWPPPPKPKAAGKYGRWVVPAGKPLKGIAGRLVHMSSEDRSRILYPKSAKQRDEERGSVRFSFEYADSNIVLTLLKARNKSRDPRSDWIFNLQQLWGGSRSEEERFKYRIHHLQYERQAPYGWRNKAPTYALWRSLLTSLTDAWLHWEGTPFRLEEWDPLLALTGTASVTFLHHYLGGIWPAGAYCTARLLDQDETFQEGAP